ncbi:MULTISPECIES: response regulator transcription factor [unclassified Janthinobacterium]|uniref:response regulator transcription factor n=1 Tax=unclassified Janthinobacterium TaxID=2610881 RepID=UPI0018C8ED82|nr:response regulator transcription factor [Janthinobacterium sp. CG_23.4]MDH6159695.1 DNA-binding response OmpR family regulator [Janthinobacterium sp. CG_23.4]
MKILLVEDDLPLGRSLRRVLVEQGHVVIWLRLVTEAKNHLQIETFDIVLLDIVLPDGSGLDLLFLIRARGDTVPVMMLTARDAVTDRVMGLDGGADDYLPKPFAMEELLSRIRVLQRRSRGQLSAAWRVGTLSIDTSKRQVRIEGDEVTLSAREYNILVILAADPGKVMTRAQIERSLMLSDGIESNAVDVHIYNLRKKLGTARIATVRGVGYALETM